MFCRERSRSIRTFFSICSNALGVLGFSNVNVSGAAFFDMKCPPLSENILLGKRGFHAFDFIHEDIAAPVCFDFS